jgi:hypothetical protein
MDQSRGLSQASSAGSTLVLGEHNADPIQDFGSRRS